ncbi:MAG TPA: hypothetical protein VHH36_01560 [Candidatus Thermoplasmatota archaeon]|nr:hypothetical protein [Candidatus Thermoplasmatota archaeon]
MPILLRAAFAALLLVLPSALGHWPVRPDSVCVAGTRDVHDYVATASVSAVEVAGKAVGVAQLDDGCASGTDGDAEFGVGGAFLLAGHHGADVCVVDDRWSQVLFVVGSDGDGDGLIEGAPGAGPEPGSGDEVSPVFMGGCVGAAQVDVAPGIDGGWWVFLVCEGSVSPDLAISLYCATSGHIFTSFSDAPDPCGPSFVTVQGVDDADPASDGFGEAAVVALTLGAGRVLVSEEVSQVGGPAGGIVVPLGPPPGIVGHQDVPPQGILGVIGHEDIANLRTPRALALSPPFALQERTFGYSFTTSCLDLGGAGESLSGTFVVGVV